MENEKHERASRDNTMIFTDTLPTIAYCSFPRLAVSSDAIRREPLALLALLRNSPRLKQEFFRTLTTFLTGDVEAAFSRMPRETASKMSSILFRLG